MWKMVEVLVHGLAVFHLKVYSTRKLLATVLVVLFGEHFASCMHVFVEISLLCCFFMLFFETHAPVIAFNMHARILVDSFT